jgi:hypothetical protein
VRPFLVAQLGRNVDPFMLHIYAALAENAMSVMRAMKRLRIAGK